MKSVFFVAALQMAACLAAPEPHPAAAVAAPAVEVPEDATAAPVVEKKVETPLSKAWSAQQEHFPDNAEPFTGYHYPVVPNAARLAGPLESGSVPAAAFTVVECETCVNVMLDSGKGPFPCKKNEGLNDHCMAICKHLEETHNAPLFHDESMSNHITARRNMGHLRGNRKEIKPMCFSVVNPASYEKAKLSAIEGDGVAVIKSPESTESDVAKAKAKATKRLL